MLRAFFIDGKAQWWCPAVAVGDRFSILTWNIISAMPRFFLFFAMNLISVALAQAQKQANIWHFGDHAGLDFNASPPTSLSGGQTYYPLPNLWNEGTSSICDSSGALLFYSNGAAIWNRFHDVLPNGSGLSGHPSATQAAAIVARSG